MLKIHLVLPVNTPHRHHGPNCKYKTMNIFELTNFDSQDYNRRVLRKITATTLTENEQSAAKQIFDSFVDGIGQLSENQLIVGEKYWPLDLSADTSKRAISLLTVSEEATYVKSAGSRLYFTFDGLNLFTFPQEEYTDEDEKLALYSDKEKLNSLITALKLRFKDNWIVEAAAYVPPGILKKISNISD